MSIHETLRPHFETEIPTMNLVTCLEREHGVNFGINDLVPAKDPANHDRSINALTAFATRRTTR